MPDAPFCCRILLDHRRTYLSRLARMNDGPTSFAASFTPTKLHKSQAWWWPNLVCLSSWYCRSLNGQLVHRRLTLRTSGQLPTGLPGLRQRTNVGRPNEFRDRATGAPDSLCFSLLYTDMRENTLARLRDSRRGAHAIHTTYPTYFPAFEPLSDIFLFLHRMGVAKSWTNKLKLFYESRVWGVRLFPVTGSSFIEITCCVSSSSNLKSFSVTKRVQPRYAYVVRYRRATGYATLRTQHNRARLSRIRCQMHDPIHSVFQCILGIF